MSHPHLTLPGDAPVAAPTLAAHLAAAAPDTPERRALVRVVTSIADAAVPVARRLACGSLPGDPTAIVGKNDSGDPQKALDLAAHDHFLNALRHAPVRAVLSEEAETVISLDPAGQFDVAIDPIDGSGSIGIGAPLGTLFCVFPAGDTFRRSGREIVAAGYVSFGHSTDLGISLGAGVDILTLDPATGQFHLSQADVAIPPETSMIAMNASNRRHWTPGLNGYVDAAMAGRAGPRGRDFNTRWIAAAVGDLHRILRRGGVFLYPSDARNGYEDGFLRLTYEAFPIAYLIEQAGGAASDGRRPILDLVPRGLHQRTPLFFGSRNEMAALHNSL